MLAIPLKANVIVVNNSGDYIILDCTVYYASKPKVEREKNMSPGDSWELIVEGSPVQLDLTVRYLLEVDKEGFEELKRARLYMLSSIGVCRMSEFYADFTTPDAHYAQALANAKTYLPVITITKDPKNNNAPLINAPQTLKDLQAQIETIKKEKSKIVTKQVHEATGIPSKESGPSSIISEYAGEKE